MCSRKPLLPFLAGATAACITALSLSAQAADRALLVGVSTFDDPALAPYALAGAKQDVAAMARTLPRHLADAAEIVSLDGSAATRAAVLSELERLAQVSRPGDSVSLYFSAHGSRIPDTAPFDEDDGADEVLLLADAGEWEADALPGALRDDELADAVRAIRLSGADVLLIIDACASAGVSRSATAARARALSPAVLGVPSFAKRGTNKGDGTWVDDDLPDGSGRLVVFAAGPTDAAAWDTADGGLFTQSLASALEADPQDFAELGRAQQGAQQKSALPGPLSQMHGDLAATFLFDDSAPDLLTTAKALPIGSLSIEAHVAPQPECDFSAPGAPKRLDVAPVLSPGHCDLLMLSLTAPDMGRVDAWYVDTSGTRTLLSPLSGFVTGGALRPRISFTFVKEDIETGTPLPAGRDRLILLQRKNGESRPSAAQIIELEVGEAG